MILHTVSKSPHSSDALSSCLRVAGAEDVILLLEDGVYAAVSEIIQAPCPVMALQPDVLARGLSKRIKPSIKLVDDSGFVTLSIQATAVQSWY